MGLVLLPLLNGALVSIEVFICSETLDCLLGKVAIGHRVPDRHHFQTCINQGLAHVASRLALADPGAHRNNGYNRNF